MTAPPPPVRTREDVLRVLRAHETELRALGIERLDLFGSFARDEAGPESDVDLLAGLRHGLGALGHVRAEIAVSDRLGRPVDLCAKIAGPYAAAAVKQDLVRVF